VLRNLWASLVGAPVRGRPPAGLEKEARLIARVSAKYALTADLAMGLLGGKLKRMELLSSRLGDVLAHLYMASTCLWRFEFENDPRLLPLARAAIRVQLDLAAATLHDLYANLPSLPLRMAAPLILRGTSHLAPLRDRHRLDFAEMLRSDPSLVAVLCPDVSVPKAGGLRDLMHALQLAMALSADEISELNKVLRRTNSLNAAAESARDPAAALAYLLAADRVIQVDDFDPAILRPAAARQGESLSPARTAPTEPAAAA